MDEQRKTAEPEVPAEQNAERQSPEQLSQPKEIGGRGGLEPTRYGDWEKDGRCIDF